MRRALWRNLTLCTIYREQSFLCTSSLKEYYSMYKFLEKSYSGYELSKEILTWVSVLQNLDLVSFT